MKPKSLPISNWPVQRWQGTAFEESTEPVAQEEPFQIRLNGQNLVTVMRSPGGGLETDRELAAGFLLTERIVPGPAGIRSISRPKTGEGLPEENVVEVLAPEANRVEALSARSFVVASSCGICGKTSIEEVCREIPPLKADNFSVTPSVIYSLPDTLRLAQQTFNLTGGLHAAGLFDAGGKLLALREDVGRHNAVDKVVGWSALNDRYPLVERILLISGRCSFEIIQKALAVGIPVVAAISAPSSLAVELAQEGGLTLIGFLRGQRMNVYSEPGRISP